MAQREFTAYVVLRDPATGQNVSFEPGDIVPEGVTVGDHVATSAGTTRNVQTSETPATGDDTTVKNEDGTETTIVTPEYEQDEADADSDEDDDEVPPYTEWNKTDLQAEAKGRGLTGTSKFTIEELAEALTADDAATEE